MAPGLPRVLVVACGALSRELAQLTRDMPHVRVECLPASLHNHPARIPDALRQRLSAACADHDRILVGYADCGTAGGVDDVCAEFGAQRLPGAHCYQVYAGQRRFEAMHAADPTVFYLTDYLVRHFDRIVMDGLGISDHPQLRTAYFGNYTTMRYLAQSTDRELDRGARMAATRLGLRYERIDTGLAGLESSVVAIGGPVAVPT